MLAQCPVVGAEVVSPLGDAVGFVDGDEDGFAFCEHLGEAGNAHSFGGDEEKIEVAGEIITACLTGGLTVETAVNTGDTETECGEFLGLVVHEGDEGRDDQSCALTSEGGELVTEGFSGAGGHDEEDVAAFGGGFADLLLVGAEVLVAEDAVEELLEGFGLGGGWHVRG